MLKNFKCSGYQIIDEKLAQGKEKEIIREIRKIKRCIVNILRVKGEGKYYIKDFYQGWEKLPRGEKIKLGKRMKAYSKMNIFANDGILGTEKASNNSTQYILRKK